MNRSTNNKLRGAKKLTTIVLGLCIAASALAQREPVYTYRYFLWGGAESPTKPPAGVNYIQVTFDRGNPVAYEKFKDVVPPADVLGCMDNNATNYNVLATVDDGSCKYVPVVPENAVLINGVYWATSNVDAPGTFAKKPEDVGMFYQWNRKKAWAATGDYVTGWDNSSPTGDTWERANSVCPANWRVPTKAEMQSLISATKSITTRNGVKGYVFGSGENTIFLPASGDRDYEDGKLSLFVNTNGSYWSSSVEEPHTAYALFVETFFERVYGFSYNRVYGRSVRCVYDKIVTTGISLNIQALTLTVNENNTLKDNVTPANSTEPTIWTSSNNAIATVDNNGKVTAVAVGTATITAQAGEKTATCTVTVKAATPPDFVLINGVKWATRNVDKPGTFAKNPEDAGMFYQWNRTGAWAATGTVNGWDNDNYSIYDKRWEQWNEVCPVGFRLPTDTEIQKLLAVESQWTAKNGVNGRLFGSGDNTIFLPAVGYRWGSYINPGVSNVSDAGLEGNYWSSVGDLNGRDSNAARLLTFSGSYQGLGNGFRNEGNSVRCVK